MPVNRFPTTLSYRWSSRGEPPAVRSPAGRHHCGPTSGSAGALPPYTNPLTITAGRWAIALHGPIARRDSTEELATRAVIGLDDPLAVMNALARVAGSHVVDVESEGLRMIRGNLTGTVRISWVVDGDTLLVGDRADYLADLVGDRPSALGLTARLLEPMGHPADRLPLWERVRTVPPGYGLHWRLGRAPRVLPWWTGHAVGQQSLTASAPAVLTALADAVHDLMTPPDESRNAECVLADLSGGLDSSTVAALAAGHAPGDVLALTIGGVGLNTDEKWARHLSDHQLFRDHVVRRWEDQPMVFDTLADGGPLTEEPCAAISSHSAIRQTASWALNRGASVHLTGHGGDHLFYGHPAALQDALAQQPIAAVSALRGFSALFDWSLRRTVRQLNPTRGYGDWLTSELITTSSATLQDPLLDWGQPFNVPPWLTPDARRNLGAGLRSAGAGSGPLARRKGAHAERDAVQQGAVLARGISHIAESYGLPQRMPFFDDRVLLAAWSCRPVDRISPWEYKPLLKAATRDVLPAALLERETKDEGSYEIDVGLRNHHPDFQRLLDDSLLVSLGILDRDAVDQALSTSSHPDLTDGAMIPVLAVESWLQARSNLDQIRPITEAIANQIATIQP